MLCALCAIGFKKDGKVRQLERYITQRSIPVWVMTLRPTEYEHNVSVQTGGTFRQALLKSVHLPSLGRISIEYRMLATMTLLTNLLKCCVMTQQEGIMQDVPVPVARV